jgi:3-hydroxybutyryl-CoA dehydrogenase
MNVDKIAVIGVGIMGSGIALACAKGDLEVKIWDIQKDVTKQALSRITSALDTLSDAGILSKEDRNSCLQRITPTQQINQAVEGAKIVFEVVPERIELKKQVFKKLDTICQNDTILASNTSTFKIAVLASATKKPSRVIGTHWMNPPYFVPLVEVIPSARTSRETTDVIMNFLTSIGKRPILCNDTPGFIVNRMHSALLVEVISMAEQGIATMKDIDMAWTQHLGPRYCVAGPFQQMDSFGLDTEHSQYSYLQKTVKDNKFKPPRLLKTKVRNHQLGLKTGKGFYDYSGKDIESMIKERDKRFIQLLRFLGIL